MNQQHIPTDVVKKFRAALADKSGDLSREFHEQYPKFCEKTLDYFERMGQFAENAATRDDLKSHIDTVTEVLSRSANQINHQDRRISDLEYRVKYIDQLATHTKISVDTNTEISKQMLHLVELSNAKIDQLTASPIKSLPAIAYPILGVIALALIAAASGQMAAFIGWLGTIKIFGA
jgi:chromosome segregation ATPase